MSASVDITAWMTHSVSVQRLTGATVDGPAYAAAATVAAFVDPGTSYVRGPGGESVLCTATVHMPSGTADVPVGSLVTLPAAFGGRVGVVAASAAYASALGTPDHLEVKLT
jgi:hypothetical protein